MNAEALVGTVLGTCKLQQLIGQGGMGAVYLAQQSRPRRQVAVKVLLPTAPLKPHHLAIFLERFRRETDAAASLEHPNIIPIHEYGEQDGLAYLVMPYISGGTLRDVMEREGQMLLPKVVNYLEQLAAALDFAHTRGVVHRDIKPADILLTPEGRLLLTDFGLVKIVTEQGRMLPRLTGVGTKVGTPDYMSPEQVSGDEVDGRADLYSLGIILFQMLTATTPFQGETPMQIAAQQVHAQPPMPRRFRPDLPETAQQVILKALAKRPADRYANGLELATAFRLALNSFEMESATSLTNDFPYFSPPMARLGTIRSGVAFSNTRATSGQMGEQGIEQADTIRSEQITRLLNNTMKVFYCYAREDKALRDELEKHLGNLKRQGKITGWYDRDISAGQDWKKEIDVNLNTADIILLLISPDFVDSDYCYSIEMTRALERHENKEAHVIPIILRPVDWEEAPFSGLQVLPTDGKAVNSTLWLYRDEAFLDIAKGIRKVVKEILDSRR